MIKDELSTDLLAEVYDTYQDIKAGKLTLTRVYVLMTISALALFGLLGVCMLFVIQFLIAGVYFLCAAFCYMLLRFRRRRFIARYFDWIAVINSHALTVIAIVINVYLYGNAAGSQLFLFAMVAIFYIITLDKLKKRWLAILCVFAFDLLAFWLISYLDYRLLSHTAMSEPMQNIVFVITSLIALGICVSPVVITGLFSIEEIERLNYLENKQVNFSSEEFYGCASKRAMDYAITKSDGELYEELNICLFEVVIGTKRNEVVHKVNDFYFARILKEFATLLSCYFNKAHFLVRQDANTFLVVYEKDYEASYTILVNVMGAFEKNIRKENDTLEVFLRIIGKHFPELDSRKRPRLLLDKINDLARSKYDAKILGREYLHLEYAKISYKLESELL